MRWSPHSLLMISAGLGWCSNSNSKTAPSPFQRATVSVTAGGWGGCIFNAVMVGGVIKYLCPCTLSVAQQWRNTVNYSKCPCKFEWRLKTCALTPLHSEWANDFAEGYKSNRPWWFPEKAHGKQLIFVREYVMQVKENIVGSWTTTAQEIRQKLKLNNTFHLREYFYYPVHYPRREKKSKRHLLFCVTLWASGR